MTNVRTLPVGEGNEEITLALDELAREGARRMIAAALRAEADEYVERFSDELDEDGHRLVVRNGRARERKVTIGSGTIPVRAARVNDKRVDEDNGERQRFSSRILPAYARRSPKVGEVIPILYLRGLSTGDFRPALEGLLCEDAAGLSATTVSRLCKEWEAHHDRFRQRLLSFNRYAYLFMDGIHVQVRLGEDPKVCLLIVIGVREDGVKELLAVEDGYRESTESWAAVFRDLKRRGLNEPKLVVGDGALGAWAAPRRVPGRERAALLVPCRRERDRLPAQAAATAREGAAERDHRSPDPQGRASGARGVPRGVRPEVPQSAGEARPRLDTDARVLRLPRRALAPPADHESDRELVRDRQAADPGHEGRRLEDRRTGDGLQAAGVSAGALATVQRPRARRGRTRRREVQGRHQGHQRRHQRRQRDDAGEGRRPAGSFQTRPG